VQTDTPAANCKNSKSDSPRPNKHIVVEIVEYVPDSIVSKTVVNKTSGNVTATSFDEGEKLCEKTIEHDIYVQVIDGKASITIGRELHHLNLGEGIIIPADIPHCFIADSQFKMITTIIKDFKQE